MQPTATDNEEGGGGRRRRRRQRPKGAGKLGRSLSLKANALARELTAKRHYIRREVLPKGGWLLAYDPRFLVFEFAYNLLLREIGHILEHEFFCLG